MGRDLIPAAVAVIDPSAIMDEPPATDNETPDIAPDAINALPPSSVEVASADVQGAALNGAQVTSLVSMLTQLATNQLPAETVEALIKAAFPLVPDALIQQMLSGMSGFTPATPVAETPAPRRKAKHLIRTFAEDALNGEQVEALMDLLDELVEKELPRPTVEALIQAAFPKMDRELIKQMLDGLEGFEEPEEEEEPEMPEGEMPEAPEDEELMRKRAIWERANAELDRTEQTYKATAEALFRAERPKVTKSISTAPSFEEARKRVRAAYTPGGALEENWRESFTPLVSKSYAFGATEVAGVGADLAADTVEAGLAGRSVQSVREAIRKRTERLSKLIGDTTAKEVLAVIEASERAIRLGARSEPLRALAKSVPTMSSMWINTH